MIEPVTFRRSFRDTEPSLGLSEAGRLTGPWTWKQYCLGMISTPSYSKTTQISHLCANLIPPEVLMERITSLNHSLSS